MWYSSMLCLLLSSLLLYLQPDTAGDRSSASRPLLSILLHFIPLHCRSSLPHLYSSPLLVYKAQLMTQLRQLNE